VTFAPEGDAPQSLGKTSLSLDLLERAAQGATDAGPRSQDEPRWQEDSGGGAESSRLIQKIEL